MRREHEGAGWGNLDSEILQEMAGEIGQRGGRKLGVPKVGTQDGGHTGRGVEPQCPKALRMLFNQGVGRFGGLRQQTARKGDLFLSQTCPNEKCVTDDSEMDGSITGGKP